MVNTKKKKTSAKKKSATKKKSTAKKVSSTKKSTTKKVSSKKNSVSKKITSTNKKTTAKKSTKPSTIKVNIEEPKKVEVSKSSSVKLPNLKAPLKEVSKNTNTPKIVLKTENYKVIDKRDKSKKIEGKKRKKKSNAKTIASIKKNDLIKKFNRIKRKIYMYGITSVIPLKYLIGGIIGFIALIIAIIVINVAFIKTTKLDIENIPTKIDALKTVSFNIDDVPEIISSSQSFDSLKDYYEYDFKEIFFLEPSHVEDYVIKYNKSKKELFIVIKASEGNSDNVKSSINKFFKENKINDVVELDYQNYIIFIKSKSSEGDTIVKSKIMQSQIRVFNPLRELKKEEIESQLKISDSFYEEALVKTAMIIKSDVCSYAIFKPVNPSAKEKIKNLMEDYYAGLESKWNNNKDNKELIKNRYFEEYQGYLIYIISHNNSLVIDLIKSYK